MHPRDLTEPHFHLPHDPTDSIGSKPLTCPRGSHLEFDACVENKFDPEAVKLGLYYYLYLLIPTNEHKSILNEFDMLNQISTVSKNASNPTSLIKTITTHPNHYTLYYVLDSVKGNNNKEYYLLMFKVIQNYTLKTSPILTPYNYHLYINGTDFQEDGEIFNNTTNINFIEQNELLKKIPSKDNNYNISMNISSVNKPFNSGIAILPVTIK